MSPTDIRLKMGIVFNLEQERFIVEALHSLLLDSSARDYFLIILLIMETRSLARLLSKTSSTPLVPTLEEEQRMRFLNLTTASTHPIDNNT